VLYRNRFGAAIDALNAFDNGSGKRYVIRQKRFARPAAKLPGFFVPAGPRRAGFFVSQEGDEQ
jgi:hypothetical protein